MDIRAQDDVYPQTDDLATCNGQMVDVSGPIWPFVQASLMRVKVCVGRTTKEAAGKYEIHANVPWLGRTVSMLIRSTTTAAQVLRVVEKEAGLDKDKYSLSFEGKLIPANSQLSTWGVKANSVVTLTSAVRVEDLLPGLSPLRTLTLLIHKKDEEAPFILYASPDETVGDVKGKIMELRGVPPDQQRLIFCGRQLEDDVALADYNIQHGANLYVVLRMRGAKPVIYLFPPSGITLDAQVNLSLAQQWEFSAIYSIVQEKLEPNGEQRISWRVKTLPDGGLHELQTDLDVSYLYWEAEYVPQLLLC